jgi:outer membrane protein, heavy metal efflux system
VDRLRRAIGARQHNPESWTPGFREVVGNLRFTGRPEIHRPGIDASHQPRGPGDPLPHFAPRTLIDFGGCVRQDGGDSPGGVLVSHHEIAARVPRSRMTSWVFAVAVAASLSACAPQRYGAAPIAADRAAASFEARSLADPGLRAFAQKCLTRSEWPPEAWDYCALSIAALYFNPELETARARVAESEAQLVTAGARPNPSFGITPGVPSPYLLTLELSFPIETAGKRGYRLRAARSLDEAARLDLAATAWKIRNEVRSAMVDVLVGSRTRDLLRAEVEVREDQVKILTGMSAAGEIARPEPDGARIELSRARASLAGAEEQVAEGRAALASAVGVPLKALESVQLSWRDFESPPSEGAWRIDEIEKDAVLNRLDVRRALAQYAAAEASLQLEIAKQYPDIDLGPGYTYEEKRSYFTVGLSATLPLFDRNQGPIAEAEAGRRRAAAQFLQTQARVIEGSARALALYQAAVKNLEEAARLSDLQAARREAARQAVRVGEEDRLVLDAAEIESSVTARARLEALAHAQRALGDLEDALQRPLTAADEFPEINQDLLRSGVVWRADTHRMRAR